MKKCPYCAEEIQDEAVKCRFCGEFVEIEGVTEGQGTEGVIESEIPPGLIEPTPADLNKWAEIHRLQRIASGQTTRQDSFRKAKGILFLVIIGAILVYTYTWNKTHRGSGGLSRTDISFLEVNALFGPASVLTPLEKKSLFEKFRGKPVDWKGTVSYTNPNGDELFITVRHQSATRAADVYVVFDDLHREQIKGLKTGAQIRYGGRIAAVDENAQFLTLREGVIISNE